MLPRSSSLVPLLLLQEKGQHRKQQQRWPHSQSSPSHSSASASDDDHDHDHNHDEEEDQNPVDATNGFWTESDDPTSDKEDSDAEADSSDQEEEEEEEETLSGPKDLSKTLDPGSGFESKSESDGSDTSQTLDDPIASDIRPRPTVPLHTLREESVQRLANAWLDIFTRYGKETSELPPDDEIDLRTGELIVDNGVLASQSRTLFGTLTKLGQELKGPLEEEQRNMRRRMRKAAQRAEIQLRRQSASEDKASIQSRYSFNNKRHGRSSVTQEEPTYGGDDFDNLLYIPTPAVTSSSPQDLSQAQELKKHHRDTADLSYYTVERTPVTGLSDNDEEDDRIEDGDDDDESEEREDEEQEHDEEEVEQDEDADENDDKFEDRHSDTQEYLMSSSTPAHGQASGPEDAQRADWEASEAEYSRPGDDLDSHSVQRHLQENRLEDERSDDEAKISTQRPIASDTQPFSVRSSMSTFKATWDDAGVRSSSLTWTAEPIYRSYNQRDSDNEDKTDDDQDEDKENHIHGDSAALITNGATRSRPQWSPPPPLTPPRLTPTRVTFPPSTPPRRDQTRLLISSPYLERSPHLRTQMTPRARALANSLMTKGVSPSSPGSTLSSTSVATSATPSPSPPPPPPSAPFGSFLPSKALNNPFSASTTTITTTTTSTATASLKRSRNIPYPQLDPGNFSDYPDYSESLVNNAPEEQDLDLDLDLDRGFLGMNLESPLKKKRTNPHIVPEADSSYACGGPGICSKDFCFMCL
ncbi:unnamed protein product [Mortierella alpina]